MQQQAAKDNPDIRAALKTVRESGYDVASARAGYLPSLGVDFFYGIDAPNFATHYAGFSNLGYAGAVTLRIPVWNWGATQSRVKQAELRREQSQARTVLRAEKTARRNSIALHRGANCEGRASRSRPRAASRVGKSHGSPPCATKMASARVLEVVDAQTAFANANAAYHDGAARYLVALANLQTLTGNLTIR